MREPKTGQRLKADLDSLSQRQAFATELYELSKQAPFDTLIVLHKDNAPGPGSHCNFCGALDGDASCTRKCGLEHSCCITENECWDYDAATNTCTTEFFCSGRVLCNISWELCIAECLLPMKPTEPSPADPNTQPPTKK